MTRLITVLVTISAGSVALADPGNPDPKVILGEAAKAVRDVKTAIYRARLEGTGSLMGDAPLMTAAVKIAKRTPDDPPMALGGKVAARGVIERSGVAFQPDIRFALVHDGNLLRIRFGSTLRLIEVDHARYPDTAARRREMCLVPSEFLSPLPFAPQLQARAIAYGGRHDVEGVSCHRIDVELEATKRQSDGATKGEGEARLSNLGRFAACTRQRWFFGAHDHLPRKVEYTKTGSAERNDPDGGASVVLTLTGLEVNGEFPDSIFVLPRPRIWKPPVVQLPEEPRPRIVETPRPVVEPPADTRASRHEKNREARRAAADRPPKPVLGDAAPIWELRDIDGKTHKLSDYRGKVVLVDFWATWCGVCRKARPVLRKLHEQFKGKETAFVSINCMEKGGDPVAFLKRAGYSYPQMLKGNKTAREYGVKSLPRIVIIDRKGKIIHTSGYSDDMAEKLGGVLKKALAG